MPSEHYQVNLTSQAAKDLADLRSFILDAAEAILALRDHPQKGHLLGGSLKGVRSLEFSLPGGAYRATYVVRDSQRRCIIFAIGPHENFYKTAERRVEALQRTDKAT